jgi:hypothetical protein
MKIHSFAITFIVILGLVSCATSSHQRYINQNGARLSYTLPKDWIVQKVSEPADYYNIISPANATKPSDPSITIDYYNHFDFRFPTTEKGCAESYLDAIQGHKDPKVTMSIIGMTTSPIYGDITLYRYHSDYFGDHLVSFVVTKHGYVTIELWVKTTEEREQFTKAFQDVVLSLSVTR